MLTINYFSVTLFGDYQFEFTDEQARIAYGQFMAHDTIHATSEDEVYIPFHSITSAYFSRGDVDLVPPRDNNCVEPGSCDGLYFYLAQEGFEEIHPGQTLTFDVSGVWTVFATNKPLDPSNPDPSTSVLISGEFDDPNFTVEEEYDSLFVTLPNSGTGVLTVAADGYDCVAMFTFVVGEN